MKRSYIGKKYPYINHLFNFFIVELIVLNALNLILLIYIHIFFYRS